MLVDWDGTRILAVEPGEYVTIARQTKGKGEWYVGAITDEQPRPQTLKLNFFRSGQRYNATIYADAKDAHWEKNPQPT